MVAPDRPWANWVGLSQTSDELSPVPRPPEVIVYTYSQLGFVPPALSVDILGQRQAADLASTKPKADS